MLHQPSRMLSLSLALGTLACLSLAVTATAAGKPRVWVTKSGDAYHTKDCRIIKGAAVTQMTREQAKAEGKKPCKICKP